MNADDFLTRLGLGRRLAAVAASAGLLATAERRPARARTAGSIAAVGSGGGAERRQFLREVHYLRAVAVFSIVANHVWHLPPTRGAVHWLMAWPMDLLNQTLFHSGTLYFVFISGLLFHHLNAGRLDVRKYYRSKLLYVISPYLVFSVIAMAMGYAPPVDLSGATSTLEVAQRYLGAYLHNVAFGSAQVQFWYLPFIAFVFLVSPLLLNMPRRWFERLAMISLLLPLFGTRTGSELSFGQFVYFFPVYVSGMYFSMHYAEAEALIERHLRPIGIFAAVSTLVLLGLYVVNVIPPGKSIGENWIEAAHYVQKASVGAVLLYYFRHATGWHMKIADALSRHSFPIYFSHLLVYEALVHKYFWVSTGWHPLIFVESLNYLASTLLVCVLLSKGANWLFGHRSRYLVGA